MNYNLGRYKFSQIKTLRSNGDGKEAAATGTASPAQGWKFAEEPSFKNALI